MCKAFSCSSTGVLSTKKVYTTKKHFQRAKLTLPFELLLEKISACKGYGQLKSSCNCLRALTKSSTRAALSLSRPSHATK